MDETRVAGGAQRIEIDAGSLRGAHVLWIVRDGAVQRPLADLPALLGRPDGFVWLDVPRCQTDTSVALEALFRFHALSLRDARRMNPIPKAQAFADRTFLILHAVEPTEGGDLPLIELDQWIGERYFVTTHGPLPAGVLPATAFRDVVAVRARIESGDPAPGSPAELSNALVGSIALTDGGPARRAGGPRRPARAGGARVRESDPNDTQTLLDELFVVRNRFLTLRRAAARSRDTYGRWSTLASVPEEVRPAVDDVADQFARLRSLCDEEKEGLTAVLEFHQARVATKMNLAMERLALITAILLPITAISSVYGMNVIVSNGTRPVHLFVVVLAMALVSGLILRWTRRHGWW